MFPFGDHEAGGMIQTPENFCGAAGGDTVAARDQQDQVVTGGGGTR
ncbi:MAG: hypothetical protein ACRDRK_28060 [Pseudonocardia sp.]